MCSSPGICVHGQDTLQLQTPGTWKGCRMGCLKCLPPSRPAAGVNWLTALVTNTPGSSDAAFDLDLTYSALVPYVEAPTRPQFLSATAPDNRTLAVKWSQPGCAGSSAVRSYQVAVTPVPEVPIPAVRVTDPFKVPYLLYLRNLQPCTEYSISIRAVSATGRSAPATVVATTQCRRAGRE